MKGYDMHQPLGSELVQRTVFGARSASSSPRTERGKLRAPNLGHVTISPALRRTARDSVPPRSVVTAALMGDPRPGRSAQDHLVTGR